MDYRELLKKYMREVINCEGVTFIPEFPKPLSQEEIDELNKIDKEILENWEK